MFKHARLGNHLNYNSEFSIKVYLGSNLTIAKTPECDAGMMISENFDFASVTGAKNMRNPTLICRKMIFE